MSEGFCIGVQQAILRGEAISEYFWYRLYKIVSPLPSFIYPVTQFLLDVSSFRLLYFIKLVTTETRSASRGQNLDYQNFKRTDFTLLPAKVRKRTLVYVEGSELNHTNRTSIGKEHTMDQRSKDKSQPEYPATSTKIPPARAHPGDSAAPADSKKADKSVLTQRWLGQGPYQEPWNTEARGRSEEAESGESASKNNQCKSENDEEYLDTA